jgi:alginate O-acetyltransferase complex protein AlgI
VFLARHVARNTGSLDLATLALLPGLSLILHFGILGMLAGGWRALGADVGPLFRAPWRSRSLAEFWGRRWNLAFSEMTAIGVYRPVSAWAGRRLGLAVAFAASGVLHELAISLPVRAGFGLPLAYFALHGGLMIVERRLDALGRPISRVAWVGRLWTLFWLAAPLPVLFHQPFLRGVVWPLLE